jgi:type I restriction enzyme R subunit
MDEDNVSMTTRLQNGKTIFLPFNRGRDGGAGNPDIDGNFRVAYFYADQPDGRAVLSRDVLPDIIGRFAHLDRQETPKVDGMAEIRETLIFPRFQQLDAVRKMMAHARAFGPGRNYLIQHSAGSGKSNTVGWTAHQAINLHDDSDRKKTRQESNWTRSIGWGAKFCSGTESPLAALALPLPLFRLAVDPVRVHSL